MTVLFDQRMFPTETELKSALKKLESYPSLYSPLGDLPPRALLAAIFLSSGSGVSSGGGEIPQSTLDGIVSLLEEIRDILQSSPATTSSSTTYIFPQTTVSSIWRVNHGLRRFPSVTTVDSTGIEIHGEKKYVDDNNIEIRFNPATSGLVYLN